MIYLILAGIFAAPTFAQPSNAPLLQLDQYSGRTTAETAMEAHCALLPNFNTSTNKLTAHVVSKISKGRTDGGWQAESNGDNVVSDADFTQVQTWINEAQAGPFKQSAVPCDIGTLTIVTQTYPLLISKDCGKKIENLNPSAAKLITWFQTACAIDGAKQ